VYTTGITLIGKLYHRDYTIRKLCYRDCS